MITYGIKKQRGRSNARSRINKLQEKHRILRSNGIIWTSPNKYIHLSKACCKITHCLCVASASLRWIISPSFSRYVVPLSFPPPENFSRSMSVCLTIKHWKRTYVDVVVTSQQKKSFFFGDRRNTMIMFGVGSEVRWLSVILVATDCTCTWCRSQKVQTASNSASYGNTK